MTTLSEALRQWEGERLAREALKWNIQEEETHGTSIGNVHPALAAVAVVQRALAEYQVPKMNLEFKRHSKQGEGSGEVWVHGSFYSPSGLPKHHVDIPVLYRQGRMLSPSVLVWQGQPAVISQATFDEICARGEFIEKDPDRLHQFAWPTGRAPTYSRRPHPPQFGHTAQYEPDVNGILSPGTGMDVPGADGSDLDVAERPLDDVLWPGQKVRVKRDVVLRGRGGMAYKVPKGTKGRVVKDVDGNNKAYRIDVEGFGEVTVARGALG